MSLKNKNIEYLEAVCWDYEINANDVYNILTTKEDEEFPISYDVLRKKVFKYVPIDRLQKIFTSSEIVDIFGDIKPFTVRNPKNRKFLEQLEIIRKAKNLIQQTEKEAIEIIEKRKLCKLKCKDTDIDRRDLIINCFTKKRYSDLNYYERELVNSLFEEENQETIQDLIDNYFLDIEDIKAIFESSPYSENIEFLKVLNELFEDDISRKK